MSPTGFCVSMQTRILGAHRISATLPLPPILQCRGVVLSKAFCPCTTDTMGSSGIVGGTKKSTSSRKTRIHVYSSEEDVVGGDDIGWSADARIRSVSSRRSRRTCLLEYVCAGSCDKRPWHIEAGIQARAVSFLVILTVHNCVLILLLLLRICSCVNNASRDLCVRQSILPRLCRLHQPVHCGDACINPFTAGMRCREILFVKK